MFLFNNRTTQQTIARVTLVEFRKSLIKLKYAFQVFENEVENPSVYMQEIGHSLKATP